MEIQFSTSVDVNHPELRDACAVVKWTMEIEHREWGIKMITARVPDQTVVVFHKVEDADGCEEKRETVVEIKDCKVCDLEHKPTGQEISPQELYLYNGKWSLDF